MNLIVDDEQPLRDAIKANIVDMSDIVQSTCDVLFDPIERLFANLVQKYGEIYNKKVQQ